MGLAVESVKTTFSILKKYPQVLILSLIVTVLSQLQNTLPSIHQLPLLLLTLFSNLLYWAVIQLIVKDVVSSKAVSLGEVVSSCMKKLHKVFGLSLLVALIILIVSLPTIVSAIFLVTTPSFIWVLLFPIFALASAIAVIYVSIKLIFVAPVLMIEDSGIVESLKRSWQVSRGKFWSIVGAFALLSLLFIPYLIAVLMLVLAFSPFRIGGGMSANFLLIQLLVTTLLTFIPSTLLSIFPATYYLKIKSRK